MALDINLIPRRIPKRKLCPICSQKFILKCGNNIYCKKCETKWGFDSQTGSIKYAIFYGNRKIISSK